MTDFLRDAKVIPIYLGFYCYCHLGGCASPETQFQGRRDIKLHGGQSAVPNKRLH